MWLKTKDNLSYTDTKEMSKDQWLAYRLGGIGCSETGTIVGVNPFMSSGELWEQKIGLKGQMKEDSAPMLWGRHLEDSVAQIWKYWKWINNDYEEGTYIEHVNSGEKQRDCRNLNYYAVNEKYPWLFGGPDRIITGEKEGHGVLEIKTISGFHADQWELGTPPSYIFQIQAYMMLLGLDYAELATLKNGSHFSIIRMNREKSITDIIERECSNFWDLVTKGKEALAKGEDYRQFEPEIQNSKVYEDWMKTRFVVEPETIVGDDDDWIQAVGFSEGKKAIKEMEKATRAYKLELQSKLGTATVMSFGDNGKVSWNVNVKGSRSFLCKIKADE